MFIFRGFAFLGFKSEDEAEAARQYFDGTYIGAAKISVQTCADLGDVVKQDYSKKVSSCQINGISVRVTLPRRQKQIRVNLPRPEEGDAILPAVRCKTERKLLNNDIE